jgi:hypothetical protein
MLMQCRHSADEREGDSTAVERFFSILRVTENKHSNCSGHDSLNCRVNAQVDTRRRRGRRRRRRRSRRRMEEIQQRSSACSHSR